MSKEKSIFMIVEEDNRADLSAYLSEGDETDTDELIRAVQEYYEKESGALKRITEYFKNHKANSIWNIFISRLVSIETFNEDKLVGLSILLMRDTQSVEAVKFGILLSELYNFNNVSAAIKIMAELASHDEFYEQAMNELKNLRIFPVIRDSVNRKRNYEIR